MNAIALCSKACISHAVVNVYWKKKTCFSPSGVLDEKNESLTSTFVEYIDGARQYLESESDKDLPTLLDIRFQFSEFIRNLIRNTPGEDLYWVLIFSRATSTSVATYLVTTVFVP